MPESMVTDKSMKRQPWVAGIMLVTVSSYVPLTVCITERRGKVGLTGGRLLKSGVLVPVATGMAALGGRHRARHSQQLCAADRLHHRAQRQGGFDW
jgi:hypothetical protein